MKKEMLSEVRDMLNQVESASPYDTMELESCMEALATSIVLMMEVDDEAINSLQDAINTLPINEEKKDDLCEIVENFQQSIAVANYEGVDDDDITDIIENFKSDFYNSLSKELERLENE